VIAAVRIAGGIGKPLAAWQRLPGGLSVWMAASTWAWRRAPGRAVEGARHLPRRPSRRGTPGGREATFTGTDTLRIAGGKLAEYWENAHSLLFIRAARETPGFSHGEVRATLVERSAGSRLG